MTTMTLDTRFSTGRLSTSAVAPRLARPATAVRLTRRGRVFLVVAALLVAFAIGVFVTAAGSVASLHPGTAEPTKIVQVGSGDTLWDIASRLADDGQVRPMMEEIKQLNALDSADLQVGQRLVVPAS